MKGKGASAGSVMDIIIYAGDDNFDVADPSARGRRRQTAKGRCKVPVNRAHVVVVGTAESFIEMTQQSRGGVVGRGRFLWCQVADDNADAKLARAAQAAEYRAQSPEKDLESLFNPVVDEKNQDEIAETTNRKGAIREIAEMVAAIALQLQYRYNYQDDTMRDVSGWKWECKQSEWQRDYEYRTKKLGESPEQYRPSNPGWFDENGDVKAQYLTSGDCMRRWFDWMQSFFKDTKTTPIVMSCKSRCHRFVYETCRTVQLIENWSFRTVRGTKPFLIQQNDRWLDFHFMNVAIDANIMYFEGLEKLVKVVLHGMLGQHYIGAAAGAASAAGMTVRELKIIILTKTNRVFNTSQLRLKLKNKRTIGTFTIGKKIVEIVEQFAAMGLVDLVDKRDEYRTVTSKTKKSTSENSNSNDNSNSNNTLAKPRSRGGVTHRVYDVEKWTSLEWLPGNRDAIKAMLMELGISREDYDSINDDGLNKAIEVGDPGDPGDAPDAVMSPRASVQPQQPINSRSTKPRFLPTTRGTSRDYASRRDSSKICNNANEETKTKTKNKNDSSMDYKGGAGDADEDDEEDENDTVNSNANAANESEDSLSATDVDAEMQSVRASESVAAVNDNELYPDTQQLHGVAAAAAVAPARTKRLRRIQQRMDQYASGNLDISTTSRPNKQIAKKHLQGATKLLSLDNENKQQSVAAASNDNSNDVDMGNNTKSNEKQRTNTSRKSGDKRSTKSNEVTVTGAHAYNLRSRRKTASQSRGTQRQQYKNKMSQVAKRGSKAAKKGRSKGKK